LTDCFDYLWFHAINNCFEWLRHALSILIIHLFICFWNLSLNEKVITEDFSSIIGATLLPNEVHVSIVKERVRGVRSCWLDSKENLVGIRCRTLSLRIVCNDDTCVQTEIKIGINKILFSTFCEISSSFGAI
jgi:hypothetical protein